LHYSFLNNYLLELNEFHRPEHKSSARNGEHLFADEVGQKIFANWPSCSSTYREARDAAQPYRRRDNREKYNRTLRPVDNLLHERLEPTTTFFNCRLKEKDVMERLVSSRRPVSRIFVTFLLIAASAKAQLNTNEDEATQFLKDLDPIYLREANTQMTTRWQSITDITEEHSQAEVSPFQLLRWLEALNGFFFFLHNIDIACR
jgi:hypothetical protein